MTGIKSLLKRAEITRVTSQVKAKDADREAKLENWHVLNAEAGKAYTEYNEATAELNKLRDELQKLAGYRYPPDEE